jgi:hypothetical protein
MFIVDSFYLFILSLFAITGIATIFYSRNLKSVIIFALLLSMNMVLFSFSYTVLTGYPRKHEVFSSSLFFFENDAYILHSFHLVPQERIYMWLINENNLPMSFSVQWDDELAEQLHQAQEQNRRHGTKTEIEMGGEPEESEGEAEGGEDDNDKAQYRKNGITLQFIEKDYILKD